MDARVRIEIRWRDLDMLGHLNQAVYHEYLEEGRAALFTESSKRGVGFAFVMARIELDYKHEVRRDHAHVDVVTRVESVGTSSIVVANRIELPDGTIAADGRSVLVAWDPQARTKRAITDGEREVLES